MHSIYFSEHYARATSLSWLRHWLDHKKHGCEQVHCACPVDNGLVPRLCFDRNPTPWTARLLWYAICATRYECDTRCEYVTDRANAISICDANRLCSARKRCATCEYTTGRANAIRGTQIRYGPRECNMRCANTICDTRIGYARYANMLRAARIQFKSYRTPPSTIPPSILVTPLKPDLVLLHNDDNQATIIELTCSTNTKSNLAAAHSRKQNKEAYGILFSDMANQGLTVDYETLEVGSLGHYQKEMCPLLSSALDLPKRPTQDLLDRCAKAAISGSYHIFLARNSPSWSPPSLLTFW